MNSALALKHHHINTKKVTSANTCIASCQVLPESTLVVLRNTPKHSTVEHAPTGGKQEEVHWIQGGVEKGQKNVQMCLDWPDKTPKKLNVMGASVAEDIE
eukprot:jgi/Psemu1/29132/gm1.29132_g